MRGRPKPKVELVQRGDPAWGSGNADGSNPRKDVTSEAYGGNRATKETQTRLREVEPRGMNVSKHFTVKEITQTNAGFHAGCHTDPGGRRDHRSRLHIPGGRLGGRITGP